MVSVDQLTIGQAAFRRIHFIVVCLLSWFEMIEFAIYQMSSVVFLWLIWINLDWWNDEILRAVSRFFLCNTDRDTESLTKKMKKKEKKIERISCIANRQKEEINETKDLTLFVE